jgi:hypothetical protein
MVKIHNISLHLIINVLKEKTGFAIQDPTANAKYPKTASFLYSPPKFKIPAQRQPSQYYQNVIMSSQCYPPNTKF